ncbi:MAG: ROK family protein [Actinomycetales bacterium]
MPGTLPPPRTGHGTRRRYAGLDIGGTKIEGVVLDASGSALAHRRAATVPGPDGVLAGAVAVLRALAADAGGPRTLAGVGVGAAGVVDEREGRILHAVNLGVDGDGLALAAGLTAATGVPARVENDVNAAAVGVHAALGSPPADLALLSVGTGLAAGFVLGGRLHRGARGGAGEVGHLPVVADGPECVCGQRGCLEAVASGRALARRWQELGRRPSSRPAAAVVSAAAAGDAAAAQVWQEFCGHLAMAVRILLQTVDVDTVVLGGGVAGVGAPLVSGVRQALARQAAESDLVRRLDPEARLVPVPAGRSLAAAGAALLGRAAAEQGS